MGKPYMDNFQGQYFDTVRNRGVHLNYFVSSEVWVYTKQSSSIKRLTTFHWEVKLKIRAIDKGLLKFKWWVYLRQ